MGWTCTSLQSLPIGASSHFKLSSCMTCCAASGQTNPLWVRPSSLMQSAQKLPRLEPWKPLLPKEPVLPKVIADKLNRQQLNIHYKGEKGRGNNRRTTSFILTCPKCGKNNDKANNRLYHSRPAALKCKHCSCTLTAAKWLCQCSKPWMACSIHRVGGLNCASSQVPYKAKSNQASKPATLAALAYKRFKELIILKKLKRLGALGSDLNDNSGTHCDKGSNERAKVPINKNYKK